MAKVVLKSRHAETAPDALGKLKTYQFLAGRL